MPTIRFLTTACAVDFPEGDDVNMLRVAFRNEVGVPAHLADPAWTLHEAAKLGYTAVSWPKQYHAGKQQLERNLERERQMAAASSGLTPQQVAARLLEG